MSETIMLWPDDYRDGKDENGFAPILEPYLLRGAESCGTVLVLPGGGYCNRAQHEGGPIAEKFNAAGINAFVLQYRVVPAQHPAPVADAARALRIIRGGAKRWNLDPDKIAICGFSAGGHLAGSLGVHFDKPFCAPQAFEAPVSSRPDALILCYPVISSGEFAHRGSFVNLLGEDAPDDALELMALERNVTAQTPPTFLWHTASDTCVPVENSLLFASALNAKKVPFELHVYPEGNHGLGLAEQQPHVATWAELCSEWLIGMGW